MKSILLSVFIAGCAASPPAQVTGRAVENICVADSVPVPDTVRLVFAGDVMGHGMQIKGGWRDGGDSCYDYRPVFRWVKDYISAADLAVANLEVTLAGAPYAGYPKFSSHHSLAVALQDAGFDMLTTANNHVMDRGKQGLERTVDVLDSIGIPHTGSFKDSAAWKTDYPLIMEKNNFRLAFLNYTYGTNGIPVEKPGIVNLIDTVRMAADLVRTRSLQPDYIIACIHWGEEYRNRENAAQRRLAAFLARNGCNLVVGAHPHVVQPVIKTAGNTADSVLVACSLGNFISNQRDRYRNGGITLEVTLTVTDGTVKLHSYGCEPFWVYRYPENKVPVFRLIRINDFLSNPERYPAISDRDKKLMMQFYNDTKAIIE